MNEVVGYIAIALVGVLGANAARSLFDYLRRRADLTTERNDATREQVIRHDERIGSVRTEGGGNGDRQLVMAITGLTSNLSNLTERVVELLSENTAQMAKFSGQIEGMNGRLTETQRLFEKRLDRLEAADDDAVSHKDLARILEGASVIAAGKAHHPRDGGG